MQGNYQETPQILLEGLEPYDVINFAVLLDVRVASSKSIKSRVVSQTF
jgi:hypothetical protein